ncbi:hypothetical protein [Campylobacter upsaliensis]|uniref:hypothetical protein n=1 Tax=Campylobacter upsaliensis TaxID=28080 RepID=UPI0022EB18DD|nr:hypothetical protein [Campylobacter upsaliensis]
MVKATSDEIDYKVKFSQEYFNPKLCKYDNERIDIILLDKKGNPLLYIEAKVTLNPQERAKALAQVVLTNKKQKQILNHLALIYKENGNDVLEFIELLDDSVMFNNDFHWESETPSNPTRDAIDRINDRLRQSAKIIKYVNNEIKEFYANLLKREDLEIAITLKNMITIFHAWKEALTFKNEIKNEQTLINLFLVDMLNNTKYKDSLIIVGTDLGSQKPLIREGTDLNAFSIEINENKQEVKFIDDKNEKFYTIPNLQAYIAFWDKYKRPPAKDEFLKILEESHLLYTDKYRKDTGGEYTPFFFVSEQNKILEQYCQDSKTDLKDYIIYDPCCGVGNLENQFSKEIKAQCYLSTLDSKDVDICSIKEFENVVQFDYLENSNEPEFTHGGTDLTISEIVKREKKKLMVIMNPPYQRQKGRKENKAISFFNKVLKLEPEVIVFYYKTEQMFSEALEAYQKSGLKIYSHIFSTAKTFNLSDWSISQMIFSKHLGDTINDKSFTAKRYEKDKIGFNFVKSYTYDLERPSLVKEIDTAIKQNQKGIVLGQYSYLSNVLVVSNGGFEKADKITTENLKYCLLSKGLNFNTHAKYFELNPYALKGKISEIPQELFNDSIMFSLFYLNNCFSNKPIRESAIMRGGGGKLVALKNYIMPFSAEDLGGACRHNDLNVLYPENAEILGYDMSVLDTPEVQEKKRNLELPPFDFREFLKQFSFSKEAKSLFNATLEIFKYYHANPYYQNKDYNDSFYDITNAIMGKDTNAFKDLEGKDSRITRTKTTKGTKGFAKNNLKGVIPSKDLDLFNHFFEVRKILAEKINEELLDSKLLLWKRENIF